MRTQRVKIDRAELTEHQIDLALQDGDGLLNPLKPAGGRAIQRSPAGQYEIRAQAKRRDDVGTTSDTAVQQQRHIRPDSGRIIGSMSSGDGIMSNCRPPWLETISPSTPMPVAMRASSGCITPFSSSLPGQALRIASRSAPGLAGVRRLLGEQVGHLIRRGVFRAHKAAS